MVMFNIWVLTGPLVSQGIFQKCETFFLFPELKVFKNELLLIISEILSQSCG